MLRERWGQEDIKELAGQTACPKDSVSKKQSRPCLRNIPILTPFIHAQVQIQAGTHISTRARTHTPVKEILLLVQWYMDVIKEPTLSAPAASNLFVFKLYHLYRVVARSQFSWSQKCFCSCMHQIPTIMSNRGAEEVIPPTGFGWLTGV